MKKHYRLLGQALDKSFTLFLQYAFDFLHNDSIKQDLNKHYVGRISGEIDCCIIPVKPVGGFGDPCCWGLGFAEDHKPSDGLLSGNKIAGYLDLMITLPTQDDKYLANGHWILQHEKDHNILHSGLIGQTLIDCVSRKKKITFRKGTLKDQLITKYDPINKTCVINRFVDI